MPHPDDKDEKLARRLAEDRLGADIVDECRAQLMLKFRFLDLALWRMGLVPARAGARYPLATDGARVAYDPPRVIARFQGSFEESVRDYLHLVMHCIFRHPYARDHDAREAWELACDIVVESAVMDLCGSRFESVDDAARRAALDEMRMLVGRLLPGKVHGLVKGLMQTPDGQHYRGLGKGVLADWRALFERDDHGAWPANAGEARNGDEGAGAEEVVEDDENPDVQADALRPDSLDDPAEGGARDAAAREVDDADGPASTDDADEAAEADGQDAGAADDATDESGADAAEDERRREREWEDVARQIEVNLETFSKEWGDRAGTFVASLAAANRRTYGYADFLRRFMTPSEEMRLNPDEFDYVYYAYGLELYGNMPLVEPLEYQETERVRDFVIVIDTSESVSGELVRRFVGCTFDILKSSEDFASEVNIHLIQCDARVQADTRIANLKDVDRLSAGLALRGFGGTDFRPAFDYVDDLRARGELANLRGLVYFTDGLGQFPEKPPSYDAAFVFVDEEGRALPPVPPWACKIVIDEAGINRLPAGIR